MKTAITVTVELNPVAGSCVQIGEPITATLESTEEPVKWIEFGLGRVAMSVASCEYGAALVLSDVGEEGEIGRLVPKRADGPPDPGDTILLFRNIESIDRLISNLKRTRTRFKAMNGFVEA